MNKNLILNFLEKHLLLTFATIIQIAYQIFPATDGLVGKGNSFFLLSLVNWLTRTK